jgi:hypothetical protein
MSHYLTLKKIGQAVAYYPNLTKKLGNVNASILLSQFIYWHDKTEHPLGVYKTQDEIKAETGLSRKEQETGRKVLRELGLITETYKRTEHKLYFLFHPEAFDEWFENEAMPESDIRECKKVTLPMPESDIPPMPESDIRYLHKSTNDYHEITSLENQANSKKPNVKQPVKAKDLIKLGVNEQVAFDFLRSKKNQEITYTALVRNQNQAAKANLTLGQALEFAAEKGWQAFTADYYFNATRSQNTQGNHNANHQPSNQPQQFDTSTTFGYASKLTADAQAYYAQQAAQQRTDGSNPIDVHCMESTF